MQRHDIVADPPPSERFDLIHARLLLEHLPDRNAVLDRLVDVLRPGGWLLIEGYDWTAYGADPASEVAARVSGAVGRGGVPQPDLHAQGRIRHHQFGEGRYEECERVIQRLQREAGVEGVGDALVSVAADGFEAQTDWMNLASPETYLGYEQTQNFASPGGVAFDESRTYVAPDSLRLNHWALSGDWTIESGASVLNRADGGIAFRFHARDVHLVLRRRERGTSVPFRVLVDGKAPGDAHGLDVDEQGHGTLIEPRLYQLVRDPGPVTDRTFEITFLAPGVEAYAFTFG